MRERFHLICELSIDGFDVTDQIIIYFSNFYSILFHVYVPPLN